MLNILLLKICWEIPSWLISYHFAALILRWWSDIEAVQMTDPSNDIITASEHLWQSLSHQPGPLSHSQHGNWVIHLFEPIAIWSGKRRISHPLTSNVFLNSFYLFENFRVKAKCRDPFLIPWEQPISSGIRFCVTWGWMHHKQPIGMLGCWALANQRPWITLNEKLCWNMGNSYLTEQLVETREGEWVREGKLS